MRPSASSPEALRRMKESRRRDTDPELSLRRALFKLGLRYRVDKSVIEGLRRRADVVFSRAQVAIFVDGCFWHSCPTHKSSPKANSVWWARKLSENRRRDFDTNRRLRKLGWHVERVWEHEDAQLAAIRIAAIVRARASSRQKPARSN
jgi:DNA mismatch endonuclease, patch repair protein